MQYTGLQGFDPAQQIQNQTVWPKNLHDFNVGIFWGDAPMEVVVRDVPACSQI